MALLPAESKADPPAEMEVSPDTSDASESASLVSGLLFA
jgi:hypothetical protein